LSFSLAATIAFYKGKRGAQDIAIKDDADLLELLKNAWDKYDGTDVSIAKVVATVLAYEKNWKLNLNTVEGLADAVTKHLINIEKLGMKEAIKTV